MKAAATRLALAAIFGAMSAYSASAAISAIGQACGF